MTELTLHIPSDKELSYRSYLILDEATMSYNMGYGDNGGCTYHKTAEELYEWYQYWKTPDRFYAYIQRDKGHAFIGEVSLHKNERNDWFEMGIIIEAKYRGMGYRGAVSGHERGDVPAFESCSFTWGEVVSAHHGVFRNPREIHGGIGEY